MVLNVYAATDVHDLRTEYTSDDYLIEFYDAYNDTNLNISSDSGDTIRLTVYGSNGTVMVYENLTIGDENPYTLPHDDGTNGYILKTDGSGSASWQPDSEGNSTLWSLDDSNGKISPVNNYDVQGNGTLSSNSLFANTGYFNISLAVKQFNSFVDSVIYFLDENGNYRYAWVANTNDNILVYDYINSHYIWSYGSTDEKINYDIDLGVSGISSFEGIKNNGSLDMKGGELLNFDSDSGSDISIKTLDNNMLLTSDIGFLFKEIDGDPTTLVLWDGWKYLTVFKANYGNCQIMPGSNANVSLFENAGAGENPDFSIGGYIIDEADTVNVFMKVNDTDDSFTVYNDQGVDSYNFENNVSIVGTLNASGGFAPPYVSQSAEPTPDVGCMVIWHDTDDGKVYYVFNDPDSGVVKVEMT